MPKSRYDEAFDVFECIVEQRNSLTEVEGLGGVDKDGRSVKECSDARQCSVGQFADEDRIDVQLNANRSVKYTERYK